MKHFLFSIRFAFVISGALVALLFLPTIADAEVVQTEHGAYTLAAAAPKKKVIGLEVTNIKKRAATLTWNKRSQATFYKVQIRQSGEVVHKWTHHVKHKRVVKRSHGILNANNTYRFRVKACNDTGCGPWSKKKKFTTLPASSDTDDTGDSADEPAPSEYGTIEQTTYDLINNHRESLGLVELTWSEGLVEIAREHSLNMATGAVAFGHDGFDDRFAEMLLLTDGSAGGGENVAYGCGYSEEVLPEIIFNGWLNSQGHRENIERSVYTTSAIGVEAADGCYFFTQLFLTD